jgi:short-subunit dehydrogenase
MFKNIIITGASSGIGAALSLQYAKPNTVLGLIANSEETLAIVANQCVALGANVKLQVIDVRDRETLNSWITEFDQNYPIDLIIANAGVTSGLGLNAEPESREAIQYVVDVNLYGVINTVFPIIEPMRQRKQGHIVLVSSLAAYRGLPITPAYCASKAAVKSYGEALRGWLKTDNIKVSVICPGFVDSKMSQKFTGSRPFLLTPTQAASIISKGIKRNKAVISFPFPLNFGTWLLSIIPNRLAELIVDRIGYGAYRHKK